VTADDESVMRYSNVQVWLELDDEGREYIRYEMDAGVQIATALGMLSFASQAIFLQQQYDAEGDD